jgi:TonB-linked SusC/RagA family outer membrane protein
VPPLERVVSLDLRDVTLRTALKEIDRQANLHLAYSPRVVPVDRHVTIRKDSATVKEALSELLRGTEVIPVVTSAGNVMLVRTEAQRAAPVAAEGVVWGRVVDSATAKQLEGAVVSVKGTSLTTKSNVGGLVVLAKVPAGVQTLTVRYLGYMVATREIVVVDSQRVRVNVALVMSMSRLQEMVTTATGQKRRMDVANDVTVLDVDSIVATQPINSVTDLLEGRVPGLVVMRTSGAPGDPSRLRLRGVSSVYRSNDPIVIVDGVRTYAAQSDSLSGNLAALGGDIVFGSNSRGIPAPSPLDQLDPNSIETIEVIKGPSAATLYGPDAANGVIVITTKKGRAGPTRWSMSASHGLSYIPGQYPTGLFRLGYNYNGSFDGSPRLCLLTQFDCQADSVVRFQALNHPDYTLLDQGRRTNVSLGVSGGTSALTYALTGSYADETGLLALPDVEIERFRARHGAPPPDWMQRPQTLERWGGTARLAAHLGAKTDASITTTLTRETQQRSNLERDISTVMTTYVDPVTKSYWRPRGMGAFGLISREDVLIPDFYQRATDAATNFTNAANLTWRPMSWLTTSANAGLNVISRQDGLLLPPDMLPRGDSVGRLNRAQGHSMIGSVDLRATAMVPLPLGFHMQLAAGANYSHNSNAILNTRVSGLADGTSSLNGAGEIVGTTEVVTDVTSFGWYLAPSFTHRRFTITTGLRLDGSSAFGTKVELPAFPKLGVSWLISEESFFPFKNFFDVFRVRAAYGQAGVWPAPTDRLRLYRTSRPWYEGGAVDATTLSELGNTKLEPERSTEWEGGFDADLLDNRLSVSFTGYRKMRYDALMDVPVAPSVYGYGVRVLRNIGVIRNTGLELGVSTQLVRTDPVTWSATVSLSRNYNVVTELGKGVEPFDISGGRVAAGYPLFGRWAKPILGYGDANGNGVIEASEVLLGDTSVYLGQQMPNYIANLHTTLSLLRGRVTVGASLAYQDGMTQYNETARENQFFLRGSVDPNAPLGEQAAVAVMDRTSYGLMQTVNTLRFNSLSVAYNAPPSIARRLGARSLSLAVQGTNLGLITNYAGKDPNVNAFTSGNAVQDTGVLPIPRTWQLSLRVGY